MLADFHHNRGDIQRTLETINEWALRAVDSADSGILLMGGRSRSETVVATSPRVTEAHDLQISFGEGPCLEVVKPGNPGSFIVGDTEKDTRFPRWAPAAAAMNLRSVISAVLETNEKRFGSLNVYSDRPEAFTVDDEEAIEIFSRRAARAIAVAEESTGLMRALDTRKVVGQAQGIVMERFDLDGDRSLEFLMRLSQNRNVKLREVATWIIDHRDDDSLADPEF